MSKVPISTPPAAAEVPAPVNHALVILRGVAGAIVGGVLGYFLFRWLLTTGFYAIALPGALMGLGGGLAARGKSQTLGIVCAVAAVILAIVAEWLRAPFAKDASFFFFATHLHQMDGALVKLLMMGLGAACAYWFGQGR